ncbi:MAG TPA: MarR family transcriptional regulator [Clostridia bacterium]|nr:MarR family transcriptional regulator [Clostridia bacterium]
MSYAKEYGHARIRNTGISLTEYRICAFLHFHCDMSQDAVAAALCLDKTTVAKALLSLEGKGYVRREQNPVNRRKNTLSITPEGRATIAEAIDVYDTWSDAVYSCLSLEEQTEFHDYLERMVEKAKQLADESK